MKLLLVDDDEAMWVLLRGIIGTFDYDADIACSGLEAMSLLSHGKYDVMITDNRMGDMSGRELLSRVHVLYPHMICGMMTGYLDVDVSVPILRKPFSLQEFSDFIAKLGREVGH